MKNVFDGSKAGIAVAVLFILVGGSCFLIAASGFANRDAKAHTQPVTVKPRVVNAAPPRPEIEARVAAEVVGDGQAAADDSALSGEWTNVDKGTRGIKRLLVTANGGSWWIEAWGAAGQDELPLDKTKLILLGDNISAKEAPYGFASWDKSFKTTHLTLKVEKGELVAESFNIFNDKSGRTNYRSIAKFQPAAR